jgi:predicted O-methyltransferase YrrM
MESGESEGPQLGDGGESEGPQPGDSGESAEPQLEVSDESESPHPLDELLSKHDDLARGEPQISANIGAQLKHMDLESLPLTVRRRIRDVAARHKPAKVVEVGAGIGHLSAWLFDLWQDEEYRPERYAMVEAGGKFGVILTRLQQRFEARKWADVVVGEWLDIVANANAWSAAFATTPDVAAPEAPPIPVPIDLCIVDVGWKRQIECVMAAVPLLSDDGLLLTNEPEVPTGDLDILEGEEASAEEAKVAAFNGWITLVKMLNETHDVGFVPMFGGTLVGIKRKG